MESRTPDSTTRAFCSGLPYNYQYEMYPGFISPRTSVYALFFQDDIRVTRKLTSEFRVALGRSALLERA